MKKTNKKLDAQDKIKHIIREEMTNWEFWNWVKSWQSIEEICETAENWFENDQKKFIKEWKNGQWKQEFFPITSVSREDLEGLGYDTNKLDAGDMERLASKMADAYCDHDFWTDLEIMAEDLFNLKKKK